MPVALKALTKTMFEHMVFLGTRLLVPHVRGIHRQQSSFLALGLST
jgi:hypothetical protein